MRSLFGESWISASVVLLLLGLTSGSVPLAGLGLLVFGTGGLARLWVRLSLERVRYTRVLPESRAFVGETVRVLLRIANEKFIPVPWVEVREQLPEAMPAPDVHTHPSGIPGVVFMSRSTSLG